MRGFRLVLLGASTLAVLFVIAGYLNRLHPVFDSISHFRLHLAVAGLLGGLVLLPTRSRFSGIAFALFSSAALFTTIWPTIGSGRAQAAGENGATYRLLHANLRFDNKTPEEFIRLIAETKPDVMTLAEVSWTWEPRLKTISAMYPHQKICRVQNKYGGVAIFSRRPFAADGLSFCDRDSAVAVQTVDFNGTLVTVVAMHLEWPWPRLQREQIVWLQPEFDKIRTSGHPALMAGDMNATPWSATLQDIAKQTETEVLPQIRGTWFFNGLPPGLATWLGLPIDNMLTSKKIVARQVEIQRHTGSDHRSLLLEFSLKEADDSDPANEDVAKF